MVQYMVFGDGGPMKGNSFTFPRPETPVMSIALFWGRTRNLLLWRLFNWGTSDALQPCVLGRTESLKIPANPLDVWVIEYVPRKVREFGLLCQSMKHSKQMPSGLSTGSFHPDRMREVCFYPSDRD